MTRKFFKSICLVTTVVLLSSLILFFGVLYNYFTDAQAEQLKEQTQLAAQGVAKEGKEYLNSLDIEKYRITWIDKDGTVLFDSKANTDEMENHLEREEIKDALKKGVGQSSDTQRLSWRSSFIMRKKSATAQLSDFLSASTHGGDLHTA